MNFQPGNWVINNEDLEIPLNEKKSKKNKCLLKVKYANETHFVAEFDDYSRRFESKLFRFASEKEIKLNKIKDAFIK